VKLCAEAWGYDKQKQEDHSFNSSEVMKDNLSIKYSNIISFSGLKK
jgi:hypothetical protein